MDILILLIIAVFGPVLLSFAVEALRKQAQAPEKLYWDDAISIRYATVNGSRIRYIQSGRGPTLVLLHTLRSQLDIFEKVVPELAENFTVYALDYPGHGFSDTPDAEYDPDMFVEYVGGWLDEMKLQNAILCGISIGGVIPLLLAARKHHSVRGVVSVNPYDYGKGLGVTRGNMLAWLVIRPSVIPVLGETIMRFRQKFIEKIIFQGGVSRAAALTEGFIDAMYEAGELRGRYQGLIRLFRNGWKWEQAISEYRHITVPVKVIYGEDDWSTEQERAHSLKFIPTATVTTIREGGHFLSMDQPEALVTEITHFLITLKDFEAQEKQQTLSV